MKVRAIGQGVAGFGQAKQFGAGGIFYNLNCLSDPELANEPLIVAEGEPGCWAALVAGFPRSVGIPIASADGRRQPYVETSEPLWRDVREIILCTYDDDAGNTLREDIATAFGKSRCKWVRYPKGCHDLNEALRQFGVRGVQETIRRAQWLAVPDIYAMSELPEPPENPAMDTGIVGLKEHFRVRRGDLTVVTGIPGHGKTSFVNEIVCRLALAYGWRTIFGSFEQRPVPDHRRALRTFHGQKLEKHLTPEERAAADAFIEKHFRFLVPQRGDRDQPRLAAGDDGCRRPSVRPAHLRRRSLERARARPAAGHDADRVHRLGNSRLEALRQASPRPHHRGRAPGEDAAQAGWQIPLPEPLRHRRQRALVQQTRPRHRDLARGREPEPADQHHGREEQVSRRDRPAWPDQRHLERSIGPLHDHR